MATVEAPRPVQTLVQHTPPPQQQRASSELALSDLWDIVHRRWLIILGCIVGGWVLAGAYYVVSPPTYESTSQLLVMRKDARLAASGFETARDAQGGVGEGLLATQMQVFQSPLIVSEALAEKGLDQLESILEKLDEDESVADYVIERMDVTRGGEGLAADADVLNMSFRHSNSLECQQVLEAIIERYQGFLDEQFRDVNEDAATLISQARTDLAEELAAAEKAYQDFREQSPIMWTDEEGLTNVHLRRFDEIQNELSLIGIQVNEAESRFKIVEQVISDQEMQGASDLERLSIIDEKNATRVSLMVTAQQSESQTAAFQSRQPERMAFAEGEYTALLQLRMKEQELLLDFAPQHPAVESVHNQILVAEKLLGDRRHELTVENDDLLEPKKLQEAYLSLLQRDLETLRRREADLTILAQAEEREAKTLVKYEFEGEMLRGDVNTKQELYDAVVERLRQINLGKDYGGIINEVIAPARVGKEVWPNLPICLALGTMLGLVFAGGGTVVVELQDRSFRSLEEVKQALQLPVLTSVPSLDVHRDRELAKVIQESGSRIDPGLYTVHMPRSPQAEIFRGLRTSIYFRGNEMDLKTIAFTSSKQGDGKTTVVANLAVSIANSGQSVLLVDADMRRPRIAAAFDAVDGPGLSSIVRDESAEPWDLVQPTVVDNLWLLPCGEIPENPAELLNSRGFAEFLAAARERYDYVILDCPPALAVADPRIVARLSDALVFVVRLDESSRQDTLHAKELLQEAGGNLLGMVVNCCDEGQEPGYRYKDEVAPRQP